jgi:hypothetical protein
MGFAKKLFKKAKKVVSKVAGSPIGKMALAAAAVYTGGASLGLVGTAAKASTLSGVLSAASKVNTVFSTINALSGGNRDQAVKQDASAIAAIRRQEVLLKQQQAALNQERSIADEQELETEKALARAKNAALARRRGRGGTTFGGANTGNLKTSFGG